MGAAAGEGCEPERTYRHATELRDHWWWRPGWRVGTRFYAWHITLDDAPELYPLAEYWRERLRAFEYLDPIPDRWLHLTMQGVGRVEDVPDRTRDRVVGAVRQRLAELGPVRVTFQRPVVHSEAVVLPAIPPTAVDAVRRAVRTGMSDAIGADAVPERAEGFQPHVSLAYVNRDRGAAAVVEAIETADEPEAVSVGIRHTSLLELHRDNQMYEWRMVAAARLAAY
jgi:2'-5' RNA ligase